MAGKCRHYILTETAERDFREARRWSLSRWGKVLTKQYYPWELEQAIADWVEHYNSVITSRWIM